MPKRRPRSHKGASDGRLKNGNPNMGEVTTTQFGKPAGADPNTSGTGLSEPWAISNQLRHMRTQEVVADGTDKVVGKTADGKNITVRRRRFKLRKVETAATLVAAAILEESMNGNMAAAALAMDRTEGKLTQTNINADLDRISKMTPEELQAENRRLEDELARIRAGKADGAGQVQHGQPGHTAKRTT